MRAACVSPSPEGDSPHLSCACMDGHALEVLLLFQAHGSLRVQEVSELLSLSRSTAHRLLSVLHAHGFVVQERSRGPYRVGPALIRARCRGSAALWKAGASPR